MCVSHGTFKGTIVLLDPEFGLENFTELKAIFFLYYVKWFWLRLVGV